MEFWQSTDLDRLFAPIKRKKGKLDMVFANADAAKLTANIDVHIALHVLSQ